MGRLSTHTYIYIYIYIYIFFFKGTLAIARASVLYTYINMSLFTVKGFYFAGIIFAVFSMNIISLVLNFADFCLLHYCNALPKCSRCIKFHGSSSYVQFAK